MKKESILLLLAFSAFACQNTNQTQAIEQEVSTAKQLLSDEKALSPQMEAIGDQVEALPEKFKTENAEAFETLRRQFNGANSKRDRCLEMLQEEATNSEQLLKLKAADMQQQFEGQALPRLKDASESIKRYDEYLQQVKVKADSIAKAYGG